MDLGLFMLKTFKGENQLLLIFTCRFSDAVKYRRASRGIWGVLKVLAALDSNKILRLWALQDRGLLKRACYNSCHVPSWAEPTGSEPAVNKNRCEHAVFMLLLCLGPARCLCSLIWEYLKDQLKPFVILIFKLCLDLNTFPLPSEERRPSTPRDH